MSTLTLQEKKRQTSSAAVSIGIHVALLLLFLFWQLHHQEQIQEEDGGGILINFGDSETGFGDVIPESQQVATPTPPQPQAQPEQRVNEVVTQDMEDAPAINKPKKEPKKVVETPPVKPSNTTVTAPAKEEPQKPKVIAKFGNNNATSQGNTGGSGDQGKPNGSPFTNGNSEIGGGTNPLGTGGDGIGFNLSGRSLRQKPTVSDNSQKTGKVVVKIKVDKNGNVSSATATRSGSTTEDSYLFSIAEKAAYQTKFSVSPDMLEQFGTMTFTFKVK